MVHEETASAPATFDAFRSHAVKPVSPARPGLLRPADLHAEGPYYQRFRAAGEGSGSPFADKAAVTKVAKEWLQGFEPTALRIYGDFCDYLGSAYEMRSEITELTAPTGWLMLRLRCLAVFPEESPFHTSKQQPSALRRLLAKLTHPGEEASTFGVELHLSAQWQVPTGSEHPIQIECSHFGSEPAEVPDGRGVYREVAVITQLRQLMLDEAHRHIDTHPAPGYRWRR